MVFRRQVKLEGPDKCSLEDVVKAANQCDSKVVNAALLAKAKKLKMFENLSDSLISVFVERLRRPMTKREAEKVVQGHVELYPKLVKFAENMDSCEFSLAQAMVKPDSWYVFQRL